MSFEDSLRTELRREADEVPLPQREPDRAVARARTRRRRRQAGAGVVAVVAVAVAAGVVPGLAGDGEPGEREADVTAGVREVVPATGPLTFDWQSTEDGLSGVPTSFETADGAVYALSTEPGFRFGETDEWPRALYRMADDGTWQPIDLEADGRPSAIDMAGNGDALYAVSTGPGAAGESMAQVSASTDGGETWTIEDLPAVAPPNEDLAWFQDRYLTVETAGDTTIALVTTSFRLDVATSFPDLADHREAGVSEDGVTVAPFAGPGVDGAPPDDPSASAPPAGGERTMTWAELGLAGPEDLAPTYQVMRNTGAGWEPVDATGLAGDFLTLGTAGDRFVAEGGPVGGSTLISDDGAAWTPVSPPPDAPDATVGSVGPALVAFGPATGNLYTSTDVGATWQAVDLADLGVPEGSFVSSMDSGPLGVALLAYGPSGGDPQLVVSGDLADWTATPLADVLGGEPGTIAAVTVGADRIVVTSTLAQSGGGPSDSRTAIGTLVRD